MPIVHARGETPQTPPPRRVRLRDMEVAAAGWCERYDARDRVLGHMTDLRKPIRGISQVYPAALEVYEREMRAGEHTLREMVAGGDFGFSPLPSSLTAAVELVDGTIRVRRLLIELEIATASCERLSADAWSAALDSARAGLRLALAELLTLIAAAAPPACGTGPRGPYDAPRPLDPASKPWLTFFALGLTVAGAALFFWGADAPPATIVCAIVIATLGCAAGVRGEVRHDRAAARALARQAQWEADAGLQPETAAALRTYDAGRVLVELGALEATENDWLLSETEQLFVADYPHWRVDGATIVRGAPRRPLRTHTGATERATLFAGLPPREIESGTAGDVPAAPESSVPHDIIRR